jgi:hypothetical protein
VKPEIKLDTRDFNRALKEYAAESKRDIAELLNQKAYSVLIAAAAINRRADRARVLSELGQQSSSIRANKVRITKSGKVIRGKPVFEKVFSPTLYAIIFAKAKKSGQKIIDIEAAAQKELSRRLSSISFMKAGWFAALKKVAFSIGKSLKKENSRRGKDAFGDSSPALPKEKTEVSFWNTSFSRPENTTDTNPTRWAEKAIQKALAQESSNMRQRLASKLQSKARRRGG